MACCCVAHDWFEGIIQHDLPLILKYFVEKFALSITVLNRRITKFKFLGHDGSDKPARVSEKTCKVYGSAVQNWTFLRFLPTLIGDKILDRTDKVWQMLLILIYLVQKICSPALRVVSLPVVKKLVRSYIFLRGTLFSEKPLRPKHHFGEHVWKFREIYGTIMKVSTLRYESKHPFFKNTLHAKKKC